MTATIIGSALGAVIQRTIEDLREADRDFANAGAEAARTAAEYGRAERAHETLLIEERARLVAEGTGGKNEMERRIALDYGLLHSTDVVISRDGLDLARQKRDQAAHVLAIADKRHKSLRSQLAALTALAGGGHE